MQEISLLSVWAGFRTDICILYLFSFLLRIASK